MKNLWIYLIPCFLFTDRVHIIANFDLTEMPLQRSKVLQAGIDIESRYYYHIPRDCKDATVKRVILMNPCLETSDLIHIPKEKLVLFLWEPYKIDPTYYQP